MHSGMRMHTMQPAAIKELHKHRSVFEPGGRIKMNVVPIILNVLLPWALYVIILALTSMEVRYYYPNIVSMTLFLTGVIWFIVVGLAVWNRKHNPDPTWFTYAALATFLAIVVGIVVGNQNYNDLARPYYQLRDLKTISNVDAGAETGQNVMDAGVIDFAGNHFVDKARSWHFVHRHAYCVAPVTRTSGAMDFYDFWMVGEDCCSVASPDWRCGDEDDVAGTSGTSGIRVFDEKALNYYHLAVQQAETLHGVHSRHPIFMYFSKNPQQTIDQWHKDVIKRFGLHTAKGFVAFLALAMCALAKFAWIGRGPWSTPPVPTHLMHGVHGMHGPYGPHSYGPHSYGTYPSGVTPPI